MKKIALVFASLMVFSAVALAADIEMAPVDSSFLAKVGYDPEAKVLAVQMNYSSDVYVYQHVPHPLYDARLAAHSIGSF